MKRWYVLQVYPGYEERVKKDIENVVLHRDLGDLFGQILIPSAKLKPLFDASGGDLQDQQLFPGYVLIEIELTQESMAAALESHRALKFLGGRSPIPMSAKEVGRVVSQAKGEIHIGVEEEKFAIGQEVEIMDGPFAGFIGLIDKLDKSSERLIVMVSIFGRMTPVELGFHQVK